MNNVTLLGRLTKDPELKQTPSGTSVLKFSLAVNRRFSKEGQQQTDFINCTAWKGTAEFISRNFRKGDMIAVIGNLQVNTWEKDGQKHQTSDVNVTEVYFTGKKTADSGDVEAVQEYPEDGFDIMPAVDEEDLPW